MLEKYEKTDDPLFNLTHAKIPYVHKLDKWYFYMIEYSEYDVGYEVTFAHEKEFTDIEFEKLIRKYIEEAVNLLLSISNAETWYIESDEIFHVMQKVMVKEGFIPIGNMQQFSLHPIENERDFMTGKLDYEYYMSKKLWKKVCKHNKKVGKAFEKERKEISRRTHWFEYNKKGKEHASYL